jgi:hypothetical protein
MWQAPGPSPWPFPIFHPHGIALVHAKKSRGATAGTFGTFVHRYLKQSVGTEESHTFALGYIAVCAIKARDVVLESSEADPEGAALAHFVE